MNLYHHKYIKYKSKYLNLLNNLKGGSIALQHAKPPIYFVSIAWTVSNKENEILPFSTLLYLLITKLIHQQFEQYGTIIHIYDNLNINLNEMFNLVDNKLTFKNNNHETNLTFTTEIECLQLCFKDLQIIESINNINMFNTLSRTGCDNLIESYINDEYSKLVMFTIHMDDINGSEDYCNNICQLLKYILESLGNLPVQLEILSEENDRTQLQISSHPNTIYDKNDIEAIQWYIDKSQSKQFKRLLYYYYEFLHTNKILNIIGLKNYGILEVTVTTDVLRNYKKNYGIRSLQFLYSDIYYSITNNILNTICFLCKLIEYNILTEFNFLKKKLINYILMYYLSYNKNVNDILNKQMSIKEYLFLLFIQKNWDNIKQLQLSDKLIILFILLYHTYKDNISYLLYTYSERMDYGHTGYTGFKFVYNQLNNYFMELEQQPIQLVISDSTIGDQSNECYEKQTLLNNISQLNDISQSDDSIFKITCGSAFASVTKNKNSYTHDEYDNTIISHDYDLKFDEVEDVEDVAVREDHSDDEGDYILTEYDHDANTQLDNLITNIDHEKGGIVFVLGGNDVFYIIDNISKTLIKTLSRISRISRISSIDDVYSSLKIVRASNDLNELCVKLTNKITNDKIYKYTCERIHTVCNSIRNPVMPQ